MIEIMKKGTWKNDNDGHGDYFVTNAGQTYTFAGIDENGIAWFKCRYEAELIEQNQLIEA